MQKSTELFRRGSCPLQGRKPLHTIQWVPALRQFRGAEAKSLDSPRIENQSTGSPVSDEEAHFRIRFNLHGAPISCGRDYVTAMDLGRVNSRSRRPEQWTEMLEGAAMPGAVVPGAFFVKIASKARAPLFDEVADS